MTRICLRYIVCMLPYGDIACDGSKIKSNPSDSFGFTSDSFGFTSDSFGFALDSFVFVLNFFIAKRNSKKSLNRVNFTALYSDALPPSRKLGSFITGAKPGSYWPEQ